MRLTRYPGAVQKDPVQRQETQIVQSRLDLRDFPP